MHEHSALAAPDVLPAPSLALALATSPLWGLPEVRTVPLSGDASAEVCVVGLGAAGLAACGALAAAGHRVVGLDAGPVGGGASGRNGGFLLAGLADFHHDLVVRIGRDRATALYRATLAELDRTAAQAPHAVRRTGSLRIAASAEEQADCAAQAEAMRADGLAVEAYEGPEGTGLRFPDDAAMQPAGRVGALAAATLAAGAVLHSGTPVTGLDGTAVRTPGGTVHCDTVVVAVDGGLERLLPELAGRVRSARAQMLATAPTPELTLACPVYARWGYDYWQQLPDGRVALGGFRDRGGDAEWTTAAVPTPAVQGHLERFLRTGLGVRAPVTHRWAGIIGFTADRLPVLERVRHGVIAVGGYCGTGNLVGPLAGRAAAALAVGERSEFAELLTGRPA
jgi:gamma-glutamylputrescine oxidase